MSENTTKENELFETLELRSQDFYSDNSFANSYELASELSQEDCSIKFLIQDLFLDHFFP